MTSYGHGSGQTAFRYVRYPCDLLAEAERSFLSASATDSIRIGFKEVLTHFVERAFGLAPFLAPTGVYVG